MRYLSVCSGIEAATPAWHPLGWKPVGFSEIDPYACAVLAYHYGATMPMFMPDPDEPGLKKKDSDTRALARKNIAKMTGGTAVPNYGDMNQFKEWPDDPIDLLVGGTPCQSYSIAGLRAGLDDPRGSLMLTYGALARRRRPKWVVWENVTGVLSSHGGRDFASFLGTLGELGYGWAYRVLNAQDVRTQRFPGAVPQRRRRVFVIGYLGDWRPAAAVLFDRRSLSGDTRPRRQAGQSVAGTLDAGLGVRGQPEGERGHLIPGVANPLTARMHKGVNTTMDEGQTMIAQPVAPSLTSNHYGDHESREGLLVPIAIQERAGQKSLRSGRKDAGPDGTGVRTDGVAFTLEARHSVQAVAFDCKAGGNTGHSVGDTAGTLRGEGHGGGHAAVAFNITPSNSGKDYNAREAVHAQALTVGGSASAAQGGDVVLSPAVAFDMRGRDGGAELEGPHDAAAPRAGSGGSSRSYVQAPLAVRRLTPRECERLQGFPDDFTAIPWGAKKHIEASQLLYIRMTNPDLTMDEARLIAADGPRYKALGNSMAVNVMDWIGQRIDMVEQMLRDQRP
jgi:DNA (cytosine-5)-methyltransferase 1